MMLLPRLAAPSLLTGLLSLLVFLMPGDAVFAQSGLAEFERGVIVIETRGGQRYDLEVELATSPQQQAQGLMYRRDLPAESGMLFIYRGERVVSMWMRNTVIPLDMLFIDAEGRIEKVVERTVPMSLKTISSDRPVKGVLELNSGTAARLGLGPGDRVLHEAFQEN